MVFTGLFLVFSKTKNFIPGNFERIGQGTIGTLTAFLTTLLFLKFDRKKFSDIGLFFERITLLKFLAGVLTGIIIMGLLVTGVIYFSNERIEVNPGSNIFHFLLLTLPLIPLAFMEELGFRAYPLEILKDKIGVRRSIVITSLLFGLYHIANGWTIGRSLSGPAVWGLVFGLAAIYAKGIAMPTGIHYAANLTTSAFGASNSTVCLWTITQSPSITERPGGTHWGIIIPAIALLALAVIGIELYLRQKLPFMANRISRNEGGAIRS